MRPTISQLRTWDTASLAAASKANSTNADSLDEAIDSAMRAIDSATSWFGKTHDAADQRITQEQDHAREVRKVLLQIVDEPDDAARDLGFAKDHVLGEVDGALADGFTVNDDGSVTHPDEDKQDAVQQIAAVIDEGLKTVNDLDETYGSRLAGLVSDLASMVQGQADINVVGIGMIDPDALVQRLTTMTPDQRATLLGTLTPEQLRRVAQADPDAIGNMDGVPFQARIDANEVNIRAALASELRKEPPNNNRIGQLQKTLTPIKDPLSPGRGGDDGVMERTFLAFENTKHGNMIEVIGAIGPGTKNVAVYVPGTNSSLDGSESNHRSAWNLANQSRGPVIVYMDGEFPHGNALTAFVDPLSDNDAMDTTLAKRMAPDLVSFGHELDRTLATTSPDAKTTFIGHSYGGSTVGTAEQSLNADRVIYTSSAGTGTLDNQPWNNPNPGVERYSMTAPGDPIQYFQGLSTQHGGDPDTTPGVTRLDTGYYGRNNEGHPGELVWGSDGHGGYWNDPQSDAFQNMVKVITGGDPTEYVWRAADSRIENTSPGPVILAPGPLPLTGSR
ncbi:MAG: alpha/beta hydrolase [Gordonia sp. (in: high G+C Gram-positive bacteria)]|uniref:alpha/beta hydrolase n=1 Tax=Gordonia sp. (in: high G+C Gram-positive bacteria) TaxID=84139 RepID=UPI003C708037